MKTRVFALTTAIALLTACSSSGPSEEKNAEAPAATPAASEPAAASPPAAGGSATVTGKVSYSGPKPILKPVSMDATPACARQHSAPPMSEEVVLNADSTLKNVFVWVKAGLPDQKWPAPSARVKIDQVRCVYVPHVAGAMVGQEIEFTNSDPTNHNIHPLPMTNREWNTSQPPQGDAVVRSFEKAEIGIPVKCNVHPWMRTYINVSPHPFFTVTGDAGTFEIKGLPAGEYTLEAWHEKFGAQEIKIKVGAGETKAADFHFKG
jgi:plastocyanin